MRWFVSQLAWAALLTMVLWSPAHAVDVRAVRLWASPESTRVVLDLSGSAQHSLQVLKNPDRVVLDVAGARLGRGVRTALGGAGAVKQVRMARQPSGELRIVLDLTRPIQAKSFLAAPNKRYGYRLVIDFGSTSGVSICRSRAEHAPPDARDLIIAIDAGHGGEDPGAIGKNGTREKDVVLAIARELALKINAEPGMKAVLTRNGDYFVPLRDRMRRARAQQADLFVSIHADSIRDRRVDGSSVYILSQRGATDEASRWLAERENASDLIGGVSLDDKDDVLASVLLDLSQSASLSASQVGGGTRAAAIESGRRGSQAAGAAGALHGAEIAGHSVDAGRDRLHLQSAGRAAAARRSRIRPSSPPPSIRACTIISTPIRPRARASRSSQPAPAPRAVHGRRRAAPAM